MDAIKDAIKCLISKVLSVLESFRPKREIILNSRVLIVLKKLGEGGFAFVFLVKQKSDGKLYALKQINIQLEEHSQILAQEIASHKAINSPYVLQLIDSKISYNNGKAVEGLLLLPYYENGTVQDLIEKCSPNGVPISLICSIGTDVCNALIHFHSHGLAFRDLKPANILLSINNQGVLADLGSVADAKIQISSRREAMKVQEHCSSSCTAPYRAPELFDPPSKCEINELSDSWSMGCTLYSMAYGQPPFDGSMTATVSGNIQWPPQDHLGEPFRKLVRSLLQTNPSNRLSITECRDILQNILLLQ